MPYSLPPFEASESSSRMKMALEAFCERLKEDRNILAAVRVGSFEEELMWWKESIGLWIIEADGVSRRLKSDGNEERIHRTFVEDGINIHAQIIPRYARKRIERQGDLDLGFEALMWSAHGIACVEIINAGEVWEQTAIHKAIELQPELFKPIYTDLLTKKRTKKLLLSALDRVDQYFEENSEEYLQPILKFLKKEKRTVPLSHIADHFAHSQIWPGHIETACEWLEREGVVEKLAVPFRITKKSRTDVEEPAYFYDPE